MNFISPALNKAILFLLVFILASAPVYLQGQNSSSNKKKQLQAEMKKLQDEIKQIEEALKNTSAKKKQSLGEILSLQAKIKSRERLIENMNNQIQDIESDITDKGNEVDSLQVLVNKMKADYAGMLRKTYANTKTQNHLSFIITSENFNEAVLRYNYLVKTAAFRKKQAEQITKTTEELKIAIDLLQNTKVKKTRMLNSQEEQVKQLEVEKEDKDKVVQQLSEKEKKFKARQQEKLKAIAALNAKIQKIIEEEIAAAKRKAEAIVKSKPKAATPATNNTAAGSKPAAADVIPLTPEEQQLSTDFVGNKGKLPWPVGRGHVIQEFGRHEHPTLKGVYTESNGVDIKTVEGAEARVIFGGTVVSSFFMPTTQYCVIVKHGEYFTVYSGLKSVSVKSGQKLNTRQSIGQLYTDQEDDLTKVHIEIWQGKVKLNPRLWLAPQQ